MSTFGRTAQGPVADSGYEGYKAASKYTLSEPAEVQTVSAWVSISTSSVTARAMIYADSAGAPGALVAASADVTIPAGASQHVNFTIAKTLVAGSYWLAVGFNSGGGGVSVWCESAGTGSHVYKFGATASDPFGTPDGTSSSAGDIDIAATYVARPVPLRSDFPTITVEIDFSTAWTLGASALGVSTALSGGSGGISAGAWTDVSAYVRGFSITRGRTDELTSIQAGTATVTLQNRDRRFEPGFAASPYYPFVTPLRPMRIKATWNGTTYNLFSGYVAEWPQSWDNSPHDQETTVTLVDGFEILNQFLVTASYGQTLSGAAIAAVLDTVGWPTSARALDTGKSTIQAQSLTATSALTTAQAISDTELGQFFIDGSGNATFHGRSRRASASSVATFGDAGTDANPYEHIQTSFTKDSIRNDVQVTRNGGTLQEASDTNSIQAYFKRSYQWSPLYATDTDAALAANWLLVQYKNPALRVTSMTLRPTIKTSTLWDQALGLDISDRITTVRRPPAGGANISIDSFVDGIAHTAQRGSNGWAWRTVFNLTPVATVSAWVLGTSQLGVNTYTGF